MATLRILNGRPALVVLLAALLMVATSAAAQTVRIVQTNSAGDNVHIIDPVTNEVVGEVTGIERAHGAAAAPDGSRIYVANESDGTVLGWMGAGPKTAYPRLKDMPGSRKGLWDEKVWSIACISLGFSHRSRGYARAAVKLLLEEAKAAGAQSVEAYPVEPANDEQAYRGSRKMYSELGFSDAEGEPMGDTHVLRMEKKF